MVTHQFALVPTFCSTKTLAVVPQLFIHTEEGYAMDKFISESRKFFKNNPVRIRPTTTCHMVKTKTVGITKARKIGKITTVVKENLQAISPPLIC